MVDRHPGRTDARCRLQFSGKRDPNQSALALGLQEHYDEEEYQVVILKELINDDNGTALSPALRGSLPICPEAVRASIVESEATLNGADPEELAACLDRFDDDELQDLMDRYPTWEFFSRITDLCLGTGNG